MDNIVGLFTSTTGRISRKSWWLGTVILIVVNIVISLLILPLIGVSMMPNMAALVADPANVDAAAVSASIADGMRRSGWASLVLFVIFAFPIYALSLKRRHDKDNNGMDAIIYLALVAILLLIQALGIGWETVTVGTVSLPTPSMWLNILSIAVGIYAIYMLVVLGFLKGTAGPNQYGPDPLGAPVAAATA
jgi:uncharacterized membrane protein YhaH (DUF805 family)